MNVQLLGAAQTVTGSCYIIETQTARFAIDCGMHQGSSGIEKRNFETAPYKPGQIDFVLLTHAHIDHSGLLPRLVKEGFSGPVYCTEPTLALLNIMLLDSANIQENEAEWASRKNARQGGKPIAPLYTTEDAEAATKFLKSTTYNTSFEPVPGVIATYRDAGHILGAAFIELEIKENGTTTKLIFSGDLGRPESLIVSDPSTPQLKADYLFLESTYGDRNHKNENSSLDELAEAVRYSYGNGQKTIIPAFAVERTQEIIYSLYLLNKQGRLPKDIPVYVDSPLAVRATKVFTDHISYFDTEAKKLFEHGENPFALPNIRYIMDVRESQALNTDDKPGIIISASGMCNAGRIKHHLRHNIWKEGASVVFTGFQAVGTPGRRIVDGAKTINLFGELIYIHAKVFTINGFSAHAGQNQILDWVRKFVHPDMQIMLVHGEEKALRSLSGKLQQEFGVHVNIPAYMEQLTLEPGKEISVTTAPAATHKINWNLLFTETENKFELLKKQLPQLTEKQWAEQTDLREQLLDINKNLLHLLSHL